MMDAPAVEVEGALGAAVFGDGGRYRYSLTRQWGERGASGDGLLWVMLNPSTAGADRNDATLRKIIGFTKRLGNHKLTVVNLYGLVATKPADLYRAEDPVGIENDAAIALAAQDASAIILAWGADPPHPARVEVVRDILRANAFYAQRLYCLGRCQDGNPKHPVRLAYATKLETFYG